MDAGIFSPETGSANNLNDAEVTPAIVFQPPKLREAMDLIDLLGTVALRVREDSSHDFGVGGSTSYGDGQGTRGTSTRDEAIANAPPVPVMQEKLVMHLRKEMKYIEKQAVKLRCSNSPGTACALNELFRKIRRLSSLIEEILQASTEMIKRFYISVFIDRQPLVVTGGSIVQSEE